MCAILTCSARVVPSATAAAANACVSSARLLPLPKSSTADNFKKFRRQFAPGFEGSPERSAARLPRATDTADPFSGRPSRSGRTRRTLTRIRNEACFHLAGFVCSETARRYSAHRPSEILSGTLQIPRLIPYDLPENSRPPPPSPAAPNGVAPNPGSKVKRTRFRAP